MRWGGGWWWWDGVTVYDYTCMSLVPCKIPVVSSWGCRFDFNWESNVRGYNVIKSKYSLMNHKYPDARSEIFMHDHMTCAFKNKSSFIELKMIICCMAQYICWLNTRLFSFILSGDERALLLQQSYKQWNDIYRYRCRFRFRCSCGCRCIRTVNLGTKWQIRLKNCLLNLELSS